jgi:hypothetical protein
VQAGILLALRTEQQQGPLIHLSSYSRVGAKLKEATLSAAFLIFFCRPTRDDLELELELIQTHMTQKPLLWVEVGAHRCLFLLFGLSARFMLLGSFLRGFIFC